MQVIEELAAHLEIQLPADLSAPFGDVLRLQLDVFFGIKTLRACHASLLR